MSSLLETALRDHGLELSLGDLEAVLERALSRGGALAELFFEESASSRVLIEDGRLDELVDGIDRGVGLRILHDGRQVNGYTTDLRREALLNLAETLSEGIENPQVRNPSPSRAPIEWRLPRKAAADMLLSQVERSPRKAGLGAKIDLARRAEAATRAALPGVRQVTAAVSDSLRRVLVVNSDGIVSPDSKTYLQAYLQVVAERDGRTEEAHVSDGGFTGLEFFDRVTPESLGKEVARRVQVLLESKPAPAGTLPVVISSEAGGTMIHEAVGHGLEADLACNGLSVFQGKLGQQVASPLITVMDNGSLPGRRGSSAYDDEGTPTQPSTLIENGTLKSFMVDRLSALKFDLMATGNGRRESFRSKPIVRMTNTYVAPGKDDPEAILRDTKMGIFVKGMGGGQVNTVTGDFVFAVTEGYLIRDGKLAEPIRGATLVGNGPRVISMVDRVGNDLGFRTGTCGKEGQSAPTTTAQPTIRIPELTVGGEVSPETYWGRRSES